MTEGTRPVAVLGCLTIDASDDGERHGFRHARLDHLAPCFRTVEDFAPELETGQTVILDPAGHPFCLVEHPTR